MEAKLRYLEIIQSTISRMAWNSFMFKGWSITIIAGLSAFSVHEADNNVLVIAAVSTILFWSIDSYYLALEKSYRKLYEKTVTTSQSAVDFNMTVSPVRISTWVRTTYRPVLCLFYGVILALLLTTLILQGR